MFVTRSVIGDTWMNGGSSCTWKVEVFLWSNYCFALESSIDLEFGETLMWVICTDNYGTRELHILV